MKNHIISALLLVFLISGCSSLNSPKKMSMAGEAQGTYYAITYYDKQERNLQPMVDSLLQSFDQSVSLWVDQSILSRVNRGDTNVQLDTTFLYNFILSKELSALTDGYFDFTIGPLAQAWGFHRKNRMELNQKQIDSLRNLVDYKKVRLEGGKIVKDDPRMSFDFNAIAQGYSVDLIANMFDELGIQSFIVDVGGEIFARNLKPDGKNWIVAIESPTESKTDERTYEVILPLENLALATSGSYRKYFEKDGKRFSHAIDPKTGYPVDHNLLSVTTLASNAALADALSTAMMVMGLEKSIELLETLPGVEAYFIFWSEDNTYETYATDGMKKLIEK
jgi:FAD:protein FMN transferase